MEFTMVEVFKTDVCDRRYAELLVREICSQCSEYSANFDFDDCDRILRVISGNSKVDAARIIRVVEKFGFSAEVLEDEIASGPERGSRS